MGAFDVLVRGGQVVRPGGVEHLDIAILDGLIAEIGRDVSGGAATEIDAHGLHVLPGVVDPHVHLNDPGRSDWEGWCSGTAAFAAGGGTCLFDMPLNASPPTVDGHAFDLKVEAARERSLVDYCLWGGLVPGPLDRLDELAARGVVGFKAFMCASGIDDFEAAGDDTLLDGMRRAAHLGLPVAVHAESDELTGRLAALARAEGRHTVRDYLASRPVAAELDAVARAIAIAEETGCSLHVVHLSTGAAVALVAEARARGADVTCETCPHYLVLTDEDAERLGALAKCAPPLRPRAEVEGLWRELRAGAIPIVASDHSPAPLELKGGGDAFAAWGGISGCQTLRCTLLAEMDGRGLSLSAVAELTATGAADRFALPAKGVIEVGRDADLALVDLGVEWALEASELLYRHPHSPFAGHRARGRMMLTLVRGRTVLDEGRITDEVPHGRLVRPR